MPFDEKQVALIKAFADQAVIAVENARLFDAEQQRTRELSKSLEQQTATSEVLRVISSSPGKLEPVFQAMLENATRICEAKFGTLFRFDQENFHPVAQFNTPTALLEAQTRRGPFKPTLGVPIEHVMRTKQVFHSADAAAEPVPPLAAKLAGARSLVAVPMLKDNALIGVIVIYRQEVRPFTNKQIELVQNFAAQAVIAIENARLLSELRESLEQQTATADVLRVISSSPGELEPVFQAMLENAVRICEAKFGNLFRFDGMNFQLVAEVGAPPELIEFLRQHAPQLPLPGGLLDRVMQTKQVCHTADIVADAIPSPAARFGGARSGICVPMLKDDVLVGAIFIYRQEVRPFTDKQIELLQNFAAQAVIAIENTRLLNELRESLQQQTATSEVLRVISSSPGELKPVFQTMLENAVRVCGAKFGVLYLSEGNDFRTVAMQDVPPAFAELREREPVIVPTPGGGLDQLTKTKQVVHITDYSALPPQARGRLGDLGGARTVVTVPMFKDNDLVGAIVIYRQEVRPFIEKQVELLKNFAAQAVIAIENTRLLSELRQRTTDLTESLEQQTAIGKILRVISNSPNDVQPVLAAVAENAARICEAQFASIVIVENDVLRVAIRLGEVGWPVGEQISLDRSTIAGRSIIDMRPIQVADLQQAGDEFALGRQYATEIGSHTVLSVPLIREGRALGSITILRTEVRPFEQKHIALLSTFADQAAIAIENVRLFEAEQQRTRELTESLEQQTATADVLRIISSSPGELEPVFQAMLENATRICEAKCGMLVLREGDLFRHVALYGAPPAFAEYRAKNPTIRYDPKMVSMRALAARQVVQVADVAAEELAHPDRVAFVELAGARTLLAAPLLKEDELIGVINIYRQEVRPFTDKQIDLVKNFAAQAAIAIENTRLLNELRQSLEQQTATADVLRVISSSPGELEPVFQNLLENATRLCAADFGLMAQYNGSSFQLMAQLGGDPAYVEYLQREPFRPGPETLSGRVLQARGPVQIEDFAKSKGYLDRDPVVVVAVEQGGVRTTMGVPMMRENELIGVVSLYRKEVRLFTDKQIELVTELRRPGRHRHREHAAA